MSKSSLFNNVQEPSVIFKDGHFEVFFLGLSLKKPNRPINQTEELNGQGLLAKGMGRALFDKNLNFLSMGKEFLHKDVNMPEVRVVNGTYLLLSTGPGNGQGLHRAEYINYAFSKDGIHWPELLPAFSSHAAFAQESHPCVRGGPTGRWGFSPHEHVCVYGILGRASAPLR